MSSFSIALSGLTADSAALDVVGNNLANLNTTGFKDSHVSFYDLLQTSVAGGSTQIGGGVSAPQTERIFNQGSIQLTGGNYDAAIKGNGFFVVQDPSGNTLYTRAGNFNLDANGNLTTATGQFVQGWSAQNGVVNTSGATGTITIPSNALQTPSATQNFALTINLNAAGVVGQSSGSFSTPIQVVDSLGVEHTLTVNFTETAPGNWNYEVDIPGADLSSGTPGTPSAVAKGDLTFDSNGNLTAPAAPAQVAISITGLADTASDMNINWNLATEKGLGTPLISQFSAASAVSAASQDGVAASQVTQVSIANGGTDHGAVFQRQPGSDWPDCISFRQQSRFVNCRRRKQLRSRSQHCDTGGRRSKHRNTGNGGRRSIGSVHGGHRHRVHQPDRVSEFLSG